MHREAYRPCRQILKTRLPKQQQPWWTNKSENLTAHTVVHQIVSVMLSLSYSASSTVQYNKQTQTKSNVPPTQLHFLLPWPPHGSGSQERDGWLFLSGLIHSAVTAQYQEAPKMIYSRPAPIRLARGCRGAARATALRIRRGFSVRRGKGNWDGTSMTLPPLPGE